ncbi:hypothetical protein [Streptomyces sp. NPDC058745]|uniref:DUF6197 family protein n=1 Tax=Streptomyces sp. NPDC058745 TaxID=3346621 RepID=UPI0036AE23E6
MPKTETGLILRTAQQLMNHHGLIDPDTGNFATCDGRLDIAAAVYRAVTGKVPGSFLNDPAYARLLIETNEPVMAALRWVSRVLPSDPPDSDTGDDVIEHLAGWLATSEPFLGHRRPNTSDVIGVLDRAARAADATSTLPAQRSTDEPHTATAVVRVPHQRHTA